MKKQYYKIKSNLDIKEEGVIEGYASVFGNIDSYGDTIEFDAYNNIIKNQKQLPKMYYNHETFYSFPIGVWDEWKVDDKGLYVKGRIDLSMEQGRNVYQCLKFGSLDSLSIGFYYEDDDVYFDSDGIRHIKNVQKMPEISVVNFPADSYAQITSVKSEIEKCKSLKEFEKILTMSDSSFSNKEATAYVSCLKSFILKSERDVQSENENKMALEKLNSILAKY